MESRKELLDKLIHFTEPLEELSKKLQKFPWDLEDYLVTLTRAEIYNAVKLFLDKKITDEELVDWANCIEMRDGINYELGFEKLIATTLFELSTPEINDPITEDNLKIILARLK